MQKCIPKNENRLCFFYTGSEDSKKELQDFLGKDRVKEHSKYGDLFVRSAYGNVILEKNCWLTLESVENGRHFVYDIYTDEEFNHIFEIINK